MILYRIAFGDHGAANLRYNFQWLNPFLRETIYPFRAEKLLDVLVYYRDIEMAVGIGQPAVDPQAALRAVLADWDFSQAG